eukprot:1045160-Prymnesium_polylepis.1
MFRLEEAEECALGAGVWVVSQGPGSLVDDPVVAMGEQSSELLHEGSRLLVLRLQAEVTGRSDGSSKPRVVRVFSLRGVPLAMRIYDVRKQQLLAKLVTRSSLVALVVASVDLPREAVVMELRVVRHPRLAPLQCEVLFPPPRCIGLRRLVHLCPRRVGCMRFVQNCHNPLANHARRAVRIGAALETPMGVGRVA